jgi:hypothetical protein
MTRTVNQDRGLRGPATVGLWLLPAYGVLLALSTITHQPSVETDFPGYARYVTTDQFLISHLVASIGGAALATLGIMSAVVFLAAGRARRLALTGAVVTVVANVYLAATFGAASFVQPGIGRAFLRGMPGVGGPERRHCLRTGPRRHDRGVTGHPADGHDPRRHRHQPDRSGAPVGRHRLRGQPGDLLVQRCPRLRSRRAAGGRSAPGGVDRGAGSPPPAGGGG